MKLVYIRLCCFVVVILCSATLRANEAATLPVIDDLQQFSAIAKQRNVPILIFFSMTDCAFCQIIRDEYLLPMQSRKTESERILIGELLIDAYNYVGDFNGKLVSADNIGMRYMADLSPTLVFVNHKGEELAERIIGFKGRDYYDTTLEHAIKQSIKKNSQ